MRQAAAVVTGAGGGLGRAIAHRLGKEGWGVVGVIPAEIEQERLARQPIPRWGTPDDIADTVAYLVTDGAGFISGQRIVVNGGMHFS
jgi:3-oxoacyl-[acyl-carrier protein] reductase